MKRVLFFVVLVTASCIHQGPVVNPNAPRQQVDAFKVDCAAAQNCTSNVPAKTFTTSLPPTGDVLVTRNGVVLYSGPQHFDYAEQLQGSVMAVTFTAQAVTDGDLVVLRYSTATR